MKKLNIIVLPMLIVALLYGVFLIFQLNIYDRDATRFITAGDVFTDSSQLSHPIHVLEDSHGFDGQFYYRIALNPATNRTADDGIKLDIPQLRHQRLAYPLFAKLFSLGIDTYLPSALVIVNYFGLIILAGLSGYLARLYNNHALWGLIIPMYPGFAMTLSRDLTEILLAVFLVASIVTFRKRMFLLCCSWHSLRKKLLLH